jgi:hypothetical protein
VTFSFLKPGPPQQFIRPTLTPLLINFWFSLTHINHQSTAAHFFPLKMPIRQINNPSPLIPLVLVLDGNLVTFTAWQSCLKNVLMIQYFVNKTLPHPNNYTKDYKPAV